MSRNKILLAGAAVVLLFGAVLIYWLQRPQTAPSSDALGTATTTLSATVHDNGFGEQVPILPTEDKTALAKLYQLEHLKGWYEEEESARRNESHEPPRQPTLPLFDYAQDLTGKSYLDLLLLRNEVYARNGYCFDNATLRQHFDKRPYYRPIWDVEGFRVPLNRQELAFVARVHARELALLPTRVAPQNGYSLLNVDFASNQRELLVTPAMRAALTRQNFVIVPTPEEQLFYLYDQNQYDYTPTFVTTDLFLQLLHKYLNGILSDVEEKRLVPLLTDLLTSSHGQAAALAARCQAPEARRAAEWAAAYYAVAAELLTGRRSPVSEPYRGLVAQEVALVTAAQAKASVLLQDSLFQYNALKPRGMYTRTDTTRRFFRAMKWLNTAPVFLDSDAGLLNALALAQALDASPTGARHFDKLTQVINLLAGDEDNRSLTNLRRLLRTSYAGQSLDQLAAPETLARLRTALLATGTDRIRPKGVTALAATALARPTLLFTAGRYTFDAEILSRLTHILDPRPLRRFPKGLDVFATFGDSTAQDVLLNHYREAATWPAYPDSLRALQRQFARPGATPWDHNLYAKTIELLLSVNAQPAVPGERYTQTPAWRKRNLSTALGGWAELKHDLLLYTEQPMGAEAGGGGGPPPPQHLGYVEPNLPFWETTLRLLAYQQQTLTRLDASTEHLTGLNKELREMATLLLGMARKEVAHQPLTKAEMDELSWIGGRAEQLTFSILKTQQLPDRERHIGVVADVYALNADVLEEAVGAADALYVLVEINGVPVIARGAVFSYYEFQSPIRLTDEEWREQLARQPPARPTWLRDLIVPVKELNKKAAPVE